MACKRFGSSILLASTKNPSSEGVRSERKRLEKRLWGHSWGHLPPADERGQCPRRCLANTGFPTGPGSTIDYRAAPCLSGPCLSQSLEKRDVHLRRGPGRADHFVPEFVL